MPTLAPKSKARTGASPRTIAASKVIDCAFAAFDLNSFGLSVNCLQNLKSSPSTIETDRALKGNFVLSPDPDICHHFCHRIVDKISMVWRIRFGPNSGFLYDLHVHSLTNFCPNVNRTVLFLYNRFQVVLVLSFKPPTVPSKIMCRIIIDWQSP